jgi:uncharacterized protein YndB with AHSA1/START domain
VIDVIHELNAAQRRVGDRVLEAGEAHTVTISRTYAAEIDEVWDACTNPERIPRWFLPISGDLRVNGRYQLEGNAGGTIQRCDPPTHFEATWEFGDTTSWIALRLSSAGEGTTRFELQHLVPADDHWTEFGPGAVGVGWDLGLRGLGIHLVSGQAIDPAEAAAWVGSKEGQRYVVMCSQQWRDADIASGTDPAVARAAADRTTTAYTG